MSEVLALFVDLESALDPTLAASPSSGRDSLGGSALGVDFEDTA